MLKLLRLLKPYSLLIAIIVILVFSQALSQLFLPALLGKIVDVGIKEGDTAYILRVGSLMLLIALGGTACAITASLFASRTAMAFGRILRSKVFSHVQQFSLREYDQFGVASLITRTTNDITQLQMVVMMMLRMMLMAPLMMLGGIIMAVSQDAKLAMIVLVVMPLLAVLIATLARKAIPLFRSMQSKLDKLNLVLRENLTGIRVIRAFNRIRHERQRYDSANRDLTGIALRVNRLMAVTFPMMMLILNLTAVAVIWFGSIRIDGGYMQVGDLMAFLQYIMHIMFSLMMVSMMFIMFPRAMASASRVNEVLDAESEINDPQQPRENGSKRGYVEFRNVSFSYPGAEKPVLSNISFNAGPGQVTAILGGTGAGKSTLINLIPRFYDPDSGSILVDGVDIREMRQKQLRAKIGFVPQQALLFTGTVAENIRYGKGDATDEEVRWAADIAQATGFIAALPDELESEISHGGVNFSGGQKQRLAIARALVRRPEIYIFDDSFSALDFKTDARLRRALKAETVNSTVLVVAQRVSTVMNADCIIVLDQGKAAGIGTHQELMESCAVYREIVLSQLSEEEIA